VERIMELILWSLAIGGTVIFVLKMAMLFIGGHGFGEHDTGGFGDAHVGDQPGDHGAHDSDASKLAFQFFSIQAIAVFCMGTGWMGLAARHSGARMETALVASVVFGVLLVLLMGKLMQKARMLESSGTLDVKRAVGQRGTVYLTIPRGGQGQVQIVVQDRLMTLDARSSGADLPTGTKIRVDRVEESVLVVSPE
jgi:membrane protein implicated in regulation of membrane protease activity